MRPLLLMALLAAGLGLIPTSHAAAVSADEVRKQIEQTYPVKVLRIRDIKADDRAAYAVTVMTQGGDFDDAFQVNTFIVDADTGKLIPVFRHLHSGYVLPDGGDREPNRQPPDAVRTGAWR